jgi:hypothetical protein
MNKLGRCFATRDSSWIHPEFTALGYAASAYGVQRPDCRAQGESRRAWRRSHKMKRKCVLLLATMGLVLVATSGMALAQDDGHCVVGSCWGTRAADLMLGTPGSNIQHGWGDDDLMRDLGGDDFLTGGSGDDRIEGNAGDDRIEGNAGDDLVKGGSGNDLVKGGSGRDVLRGGSGADRIKAQDGFADVISCGAGSGDLIFFDQGLDSVAADCEPSVALEPAPEPASQQCSAGNRVNSKSEGTNGPDYLYGDCYHDNIFGLPGNDHLYGGPGSDDLWGGRGHDTCVSGQWHDCE